MRQSVTHVQVGQQTVGAQRGEERSGFAKMSGVAAVVITSCTAWSCIHPRLKPEARLTSVNTHQQTNRRLCCRPTHQHAITHQSYLNSEHTGRSNGDQKVSLDQTQYEELTVLCETKLNMR